MNTRSNAAVAIGITATLALMVGCGPKNTAATKPPTIPVAPATSAPATSAPAASAPATPPVRDRTPGNCTIYTKADATTLIGAVDINNKAIDIKTDGGTKIDVCSYLDLKGTQDLQGLSYAVVRYDSGATAFAEAKKVQVEMLGSAAENNWAVQSLTTPVPGAGPLLGGYGTHSDNGLPFTIAVVGTNVGPYLVVALGASTESAANAKRFALALFQTLAAAVG